MRENRFVVHRIWNKSDIVAIFLTGTLCGALFLGTVLHFDKPLPVEKKCQQCHAPEEVIYKTLGQYRRAMKRKALLADKGILTDLVAR
jgi:hypothetical protein